jgi:hypothetical protein
MYEISYTLKNIKQDSKFACTVYADDISISIKECETKEKTWELINKIKEEVECILKEYNFNLNKNKTRVKYEKYGARRILGINVTNEGVFPTRKTNRKVRCVQHQTKYSKDKKYVLKGLQGWQSCPFPKQKKKYENCHATLA